MKKKSRIFLHKKVPLEYIAIWHAAIVILFILILGWQISILSGQLQQERTRMVTQAKIQGHFSELLSNYKKMDYDISKVLRIRPNQEQVVEFVEYIEDLSNAFNLQQELIYKDEEIRYGRFRTIAFEVNLEGSLPFIMQFIRGLENLLYLTEIRSVNFEVGEEGGRASIALNLYIK